jgi:hypothetical protein
MLPEELLETLLLYGDILQSAWVVSTYYRNPLHIVELYSRQVIFSLLELRLSQIPGSTDSYLRVNMEDLIF